MKELTKEVKMLRKESKGVKEENRKYKKTLKSMKMYIDKTGNDDDIS